MAVLRLDSPRWSQLRHAYGPAGDVPAMIESLAAQPGRAFGDLVWEPFWDAICHQGSAYTASFAVLPHLVALVESVPAIDQVPYWVLIGAIAGSFDASPIPHDLQADYEDSVQRGERLARAALSVPGRTEHDVIYLLEAVAALRGHRGVAALLEGFVDEEFRPSCPACRHDLFVRTQGEEMIATVEDPATQRTTRETAVQRPVTPMLADDPDREEWDPSTILDCLTVLARRAAHPGLAMKLVTWQGIVSCPSCEHAFPLAATLLDQFAQWRTGARVPSR